jgi:glucokinase
MKTPGQALGIDIGGTKTAVGVVDREGRVLSQRVFPTEAELGFDRAVERIANSARELAVSAGIPLENLAGIGIGCAGPVDPRRGEIHNPFTLAGWDRCNIVAPLGAALGLPVWLENDADAAAIGEWYYGAGQGADSLVMLTFGTGVGGAVLTRNRIHRGVSGDHPEIGHLVVAADGPECYCGRRGCLESFASGSAIGRAGEASGLPDAAAVFAAADQGDPSAGRILSQVSQALDAAIWTLLHTFLPERIVLGGGLVEAREEFFLSTARAALSRATQIPRDRISIAPARLGNRAGLVGAARRAMEGAEPSHLPTTP